MNSKSFDSNGGVVYIAGGEVSCCLKVVGSYCFCLGFYCDMVRKVVLIVLSEIYLFHSEYVVMC
jgi:hypothetical protein